MLARSLAKGLATRKRDRILLCPEGQRPLKTFLERPSWLARTLRDEKAAELDWGSRSVVLYIEDNAANVAFVRDLLEG